MSETASISTGIAARYAIAVFEIAQDAVQLETLERDVDALAAALDESAELRALIASPLHDRETQGRAMAAVAEKMGLMPALRNTIGLMAQKRRLFVLPQLVQQLRARIAEHKGEVTADVTAAQPLSDAQSKALAETLKKTFGGTVKINSSVDEALIGGLVVKVGSKMIDTSIRSRLDSMKNAMKEVR